MTTESLFETPHQERYFEDYLEGAIHTFGRVAVHEKMIIEFASRYDPQFFHVDPEKAEDSIYGGLISSGWHTTAIMMSQLALYYFSDVSSMGSPGLTDLRWMIPVRPGDTLSVRTTTTEARRSSSKPDRGIIKTFIEVLNQGSAVVMDLKATSFIACRS
jgi:acyl dehydratase